MNTDTNDFEYGSPIPEGALFVAADEPLLVFPSARAAERWIEAVDVEAGVYPAAYGPNGEPFSVTTDGNRVIVERTGEPDKPDALRALLLRYLEGSGRPADASLSFNELVATVWAIESGFWQKNDPYSERFAPRIPFWVSVAFLIVLAVGLYLAFG